MDIVFSINHETEKVYADIQWTQPTKAVITISSERLNDHFLKDVLHKDSMDAGSIRHEY